jgi:hypothetical protein
LSETTAVAVEFSTMKVGDPSGEQLHACASKTEDPEVLLGLAKLAAGAGPVWKEISERALAAKAEYAPVLSMIAAATERLDEKLIDELIARDSDNALGYYLRGRNHYQFNREEQSLENFRKGATLAEIRMYGTIITNGLFKALDAMNIQGGDRLALLSGVARGTSNFGSSHLQHLRHDLSELARKADPAVKREIAQILLILGGQLYATNFWNRQFGEWTIGAAFHISAEIAAADGSMAARGYAAAAHAIRIPKWTLPGMDKTFREYSSAAIFLPSRISMALSMADPTRATTIGPVDLSQGLSADDKAALDKARQDSARSAGALIELSLRDPDEIIGAYLKDLPTAPVDSARPMGFTGTYVENLLLKRPDLLEAAAEFERFIAALGQAGKNHPITRNMSRLMGLGIALFRYMAGHDQKLPESLEVLYRDGKYLKSEEHARSVLTGKPYVYAAAGKTLPHKQSERDTFVLAYDDSGGNGECQFVTAVGSAGNMKASEFTEMMRKSGQ